MKRLFALFVLIATINLIAKSQTADKITVVDTRDIDSAPIDYNREVKFEFKRRTTIGVPGSGSYSGTMTFAPWGDNTGDKSHQLNFNEGGVFYRTGEPDATSWDAWRQLVITSANGNVGIGISTPVKTLHIGSGNHSSILLQGATEAGSTSELLFKASNTNFEDNYIKAGIFFERTSEYALGNMHFAINNEGNANNVSLSDSKMIITRAGNIGIGTTTPTNKLDVNGTIRAEEIKVETGWADFVFHPTYNLRPLQEVNTYIQQNGHLPEIPTAKEVEENGVSLGEMNAKLLQKIEELTLYTIEQEKRIEELEKQNSRIDELEKIIKKLQ